jgi:hypothetical protein
MKIDPRTGYLSVLAPVRFFFFLRYPAYIPPYTRSQLVFAPLSLFVTSLYGIWVGVSSRNEIICPPRGFRDTHQTTTIWPLQVSTKLGQQCTH